MTRYSDTLLLLQLYWRLDRRENGGTGRLGWLRPAMIGVIVMGASILAGFGTGAATRSALDAGIIGADQVGVIPGVLLTLLLAGTAVAGFNQALQALFLSDDLERLLVAPVPLRAVVTAKLLGRLPGMMFLLLSFALPALLAFGVTLGYGPLYYAISVVLVLLAPLFGISLGALTAIFLVRLLPAQRLSDWVGAASIVIGTLISMAIYLPRLLSDGDSSFAPQDEAALAAMIQGASDLPLPSIWAGAALADLAAMQISPAVSLGLPAYLLITAGFFTATLLVADRFYLASWLRVQSAGASNRGRTTRAGIFGGDSLDLILAYKDWLLRVRNPQLLATLFSGMVGALFMIVFLLRPGGSGSVLDLPAELPDFGQISMILALVFSPGVIAAGAIYFIGWSSLSRVAGSALSIEREGVYILKSAPISPVHILRAKVYGVLLPYTLLTTILLVAGIFVLDYSPLWALYAWLVLQIMGAGVFTYAVSLDMIYPNLTWEDPRRMTNRKAGLPSLIGTALYSAGGLLLALVAFVIAGVLPALAVPAIALGLGLLTGGTWLFVRWRVARAAAAWPTIGER